MNYESCTLAELRDVAAHIDRESFPERAAEVEREIRRREALPIEQQEPVTFHGTLVGAAFNKPVGAELSFSTTELSLTTTPIFGVGSFQLARADVERIVERTGFFRRGFQFVHHRPELPPKLRFEPERWAAFKAALIARRWPVGAS